MSSSGVGSMRTAGDGDSSALVSPTTSSSTPSDSAGASRTSRTGAISARPPRVGMTTERGGRGEGTRPESRVLAPRGARSSRASRRTRGRRTAAARRRPSRSGRGSSRRGRREASASRRGFSGSCTIFSTIQRIRSGRRSKLRSKERKPGSLISFSMSWYLSLSLALDFSHSRSNCSEVKASSTPAKANALRIVSSRSVCSSSWVMISICERSNAPGRAAAASSTWSGSCRRCRAARGPRPSRRSRSRRRSRAPSGRGSA